MNHEEHGRQLKDAYPGLYDEFRKWYLETSVEFGEDSMYRTDDRVLMYFEVFMLRRKVPFRSYSRGIRRSKVVHPPDHLITLRDMALI